MPNSIVTNQGTPIAQWLQLCATNHQAVGLNKTNICICEMISLDLNKILYSSWLLDLVLKLHVLPALRL